MQERRRQIETNRIDIGRQAHRKKTREGYPHQLSASIVQAFRRQICGDQEPFGYPKARKTGKTAAIRWERHLAVKSKYSIFVAPKLV